MTVHHSLARLPGPRGTRYVLTEPKSPHSRRTVPLAAPALAVLNALRRDALAGKPNPHNLVFARDGKPIDGTALTHEFQAALKAAGMDSMHWHDLRHAWVSLMLESGMSIYQVSKMAGHSGIAITADIYGHITPAADVEGIERMAARIGAL